MKNNFRWSVSASLGLHALIIGVLMLSVNFVSDPMAMPATNAPIIKAKFIDAQAIADRQKAQAEAEAKEKKRIEQKRREAAEAKKKKERAAEAARVKKQKELERKAAEAAARKRKEREQQEKREKEQAEKDAMDKLMEDELAKERQAQNARRSQQVMSEVDKYKALIQQTIMQSLFEDPDFKGKKCRLNIRLATTGLVSGVSIRDGDPALCREAKNAVLRPDKLPVSSDLDVYEKLKNINLTVEL